MRTTHYPCSSRRKETLIKWDRAKRKLIRVSLCRLLQVGLAFFATSALAQLNPGNPLANLEKLKDFQTIRASSSDPDWKNGNGDARPIAPGGTLTLATLEGPGEIVHIWFTIAHNA